MDQENKGYTHVAEDLNEKVAAAAVFHALIYQATVRELPPIALMEHVRALALEKWGTG